MVVMMTRWHAMRMCMGSRRRSMLMVLLLTELLLLLHVEVAIPQTLMLQIHLLLLPLGPLSLPVHITSLHFDIPRPLVSLLQLPIPHFSLPLLLALTLHIKVSLHIPLFPLAMPLVTIILIVDRSLQMCHPTFPLNPVRRRLRTGHIRSHTHPRSHPGPWWRRRPTMLHGALSIWSHGQPRRHRSPATTHRRCWGLLLLPMRVA